MECASELAHSIRAPHRRARPALRRRNGDAILSSMTGPAGRGDRQTAMSRRLQPRTPALARSTATVLMPTAPGQMNVNVWDVTDPIRALIESAEHVDPARLSDLDVPLADLARC